MSAADERANPGRGHTAAVAAAAAITVLDGFDALSISLMMPAISREFGISTAAIGPVFASVMGGMAVGAFGGGALADKFGRLRALMVALVLFGATALTMPLVGGIGEIMLNRFVAGIGLGAAAPIAVALLNRGGTPPSEFAIALVWSGIGIGGMLAALFNYLFADAYGWRFIFVVGGLAPIPVALVAYLVFRGDTARSTTASSKPRPRLSDLFTHGQLWRTLTVAGMFFSGFITVSVILNWLPTVLSNRSASILLISSSFAAINGGSVVFAALLGFMASRGQAGRVRTATWAAAALFGFVASLPGLTPILLAAFAICGAIAGASAQALSIALANELHRERGLQTTSVGFMAASARVGQFSALGISGAVAAGSGQDTLVFALAGFTAAVAALLSAVAARSDHRAAPALT